MTSEETGSLQDIESHHYAAHALLLQCLMMHKWIVVWKRPDLLCGLYLRVLLWLGGVGVAYGGGVASTEPSAVCDCIKQERYARNYDYMEGGDVRIRRLYSRTQWFLTVDENGNINGTQDPNNCYSERNTHTHTHCNLHSL